MTSTLSIFSLLVAASMILASIPNSYALEVAGTYTEINYTVKLDAQKYFVNFNVCSTEKTIELAKILITTDSDSQLLTFPMLIVVGTCHTVESLVNAKHPNSIEITLVE